MNIVPTIGWTKPDHAGGGMQPLAVVTSYEDAAKVFELTRCDGAALVALVLCVSPPKAEICTTLAAARSFFGF